jgi:ABC-type phosphate transport system substrate-binding protein
MNKKILIPVLLSTLLAGAARADYDLVVVGSTAFRSVVFDRAASMYDGGIFTKYTNGNANTVTYSGTMSNLFGPSFGSTLVNFRFSFSGSGTGMGAVYSGSSVPVVDLSNGSTNSMTPHMALSDVYPATANLPDGAFEQQILGVVPFAFFHNNNAAGMASVTNITREQAILLMTASGVVTSGGNVIQGMPTTYLGGTDTNAVYLVGRDSGSGTRITVQQDIQFTGTPVNWDLSSTPVISPAGGLSSGGTLVSQVKNTSLNAIGYAGLADITSGTNEGSGPNQVTRMMYSGVPCNHTNVTTGAYPIWGYEHFVNVPGLSTQQGQVRDALVTAITDPNYQHTNTVYNIPFSSLSDMQVQRGGDGADITSKNF